jgi:hypothetical protein
VKLGGVGVGVVGVVGVVAVELHVQVLNATTASTIS